VGRRILEIIKLFSVALIKVLIAATRQGTIFRLPASIGYLTFYRGSKLKQITSILLCVAVVATALPLVASAKMVKACKDKGITEIKNCASCHDSKKPSEKDLNEVGKWLVEQKRDKKAEDYDMTWLREYFDKKK